MRVCSKPGCERVFYCKQLCRGCYEATRYAKSKGGDTSVRKVYAKRTYEKNKSKIRARQKDYYDKNSVQINQWHREYYAKNKEAQRARCKAYREKNKAEYNAVRHQRKKKLALVTPSWADKEAIKEFYKNRPEGYHVDHILPINGKNVCGLHVVDNLQYLPAIENLRKSNKVAA